MRRDDFHALTVLLEKYRWRRVRSRAMAGVGKANRFLLYLWLAAAASFADPEVDTNPAIRAEVAALPVTTSYADDRIRIAGVFEDLMPAYLEAFPRGEQPYPVFVASPDYGLARAYDSGAVGLNVFFVRLLAVDTLRALLAHEFGHIGHRHQHDCLNAMAEGQGPERLRQLKHDQEKAADRSAVTLLRSSGFNAEALPVLLENTANEVETPTHPSYAARISALPPYSGHVALERVRALK